MKFSVITLFPEMIRAYSGESILKRAVKKDLLSVRALNPRKFAKDRRRKVDDRPYGGGPGMVLKAEPLLKAALALARGSKRRPIVILLSPAGGQFTSASARRFAAAGRDLIFVAGHYEGIDARLRPALKASGFRVEEISAGPFVVTGGELPALMMIDAVSRHIPGVLGKSESREEARHGVGMPVYTRPEMFRFRGKAYRVPGVLLGGNHAAIEKWRKVRAKKVDKIA